MAGRQNPFFVGGPVPPGKFVGRKFEIATAFDQIANRSHAAIWGSSGIGKSSLLKYLASPQGWKDYEYESEFSQAVIVDLDCYSDISTFTPVNFWKSVLKKLSSKLEIKPEFDNSILPEVSKLIKELENNDTGEEFLQKILKLIQDKGNYFLVLLLDDFDVALKPNENYDTSSMKTFLSRMCSLTRTAENLSIIITSKRPLNQYTDTVPKILGSDWYNNYVPFCPLKPFETNEVEELLVKMPWSSIGQINKIEIIRTTIREIADGHPALLQNVLHFLYNSYKNDRHFDIRNLDNECKLRYQYIPEHIWKCCSKVEQQYLTCLALSNPGVRGSNVAIDPIKNFLKQNFTIRDNLKTQGIITEKPYPISRDETFYYFKFLLMEYWITQKIQECSTALQNQSNQDNQDSSFGDFLKDLEKVLFRVSRGQIKQLSENIDLFYKLIFNENVIKGLATISDLISKIKPK